MEMNQTNTASDKAMSAGVDALVETLQRAYGSKRK